MTCFELHAILPRRRQICAGLFLATGLLAGSTALADRDLPLELEAFIVEETSLLFETSLSPLSRPVSELFGNSRNLLEIPRSVSVLTPEAMRQFGVRDPSDLSFAVAGTQRVNYFGVPGAPQIRGDLASVYFNGLRRAFQRNEMPTSFGAVEALDIVKGPAPAHFGPSQAGGFINLIPKAPFFDQPRGSVQVTVGTYGYYHTQIDQGGPIMLDRYPAAYRISLSGQKAQSYYHNVRNDYLSLYLAGKVRLRNDLTLFAGTEFYLYRSNENAGWNRVTQELIDHGKYLVGEVVDLVQRPFNRSREGLSKGVTPFTIVPSLPGQEPLTFSTGGPVTGLAAIVPPAEFVASLPPDLRKLLGPDGQYTAAYLNAGGPLASRSISGRTVLSDPNDYANATNALLFMDVENRREPNRPMQWKTLLDLIRTEKLSSYGYAFEMDQVFLNSQLSFQQDLPAGKISTLTYGAGLILSRARQLVDFDDEPFSRRDISRPDITPNSIVLTGPQRDAEGLNHWSRFGGSIESELWQPAIFALWDTRWNSLFATMLSVRGEYASFRQKRPRENDRMPDRGQLLARGDTTYWNLGLGTVLNPADHLSLYLNLQHGRAFQPSPGGVVQFSQDEVRSFPDAELVEAGIKIAAWEDRFFASLAGYAYTRTFTQTTAAGTTRNGQRGHGVELEISWLPDDHWSFALNATAARTFLRNEFGFRFQPTQDFYMPLVAGGLYAGGTSGNELVARNNPDRIIPGQPEVVVNLLTAYEFGNGWGMSIRPTWRDGYYHNAERTLRIPSVRLVHANLWYRADRWELWLETTNLLSERHFLGSDPFFSANALLTPAPPIEAKLGLTIRF